MPGGDAPEKKPVRQTSPATKRARQLRRDETEAEYRLWYELSGRRLNGRKFVRQSPVGPYIVDFACRDARLAIEIDGSQHAGSRGDLKRTKWLNAHGWSVLRFWNTEVLHERRAVCETILAVLDERVADRSEGAGMLDGLRFAPARPSPGGFAATLSPERRGRAPGSVASDCQASSFTSVNHVLDGGALEPQAASSPRRGSDGPEGRMRGAAPPWRP
ncbi:endonuclease domain-containing protein [Aurantimonas sp. MSK8Z-1]|uniref:endonuclease domain-containing protein n=1 Tax=Mangrovibrevibacter kandeliae TaxID=2968473 RepID=UPI0021178059|nr:endonuclease domain-containing protein [Aurantimonas sp. MSK8Z-1]MCW4113676.1 endonuclease domain-containing protein [Aurantimonas sp. MSK8Z-1]